MRKPCNTVTERFTHPSIAYAPLEEIKNQSKQNKKYHAIAHQLGS